MTSVLRDNFEETFPEIEEVLRKSAFVSIDTEFSGLVKSNDFKSSLFDSSTERYLKQRENISDVLLMQFGLTGFIFDREKGTYTSHSYCFYLFPRTFGSIDLRFSCQASSFEFLSHHNFSFDKFVYNGISFLNEEQEKRVQQELRDGQLFRLVERALSFDDEHSVQALCSQVSLWLQGGEPAQPVDEAAEKSIVLEVPKSTQSSQCIAYVLHHELRRRFARVWTYPEKGNVRVVKISEVERSMLENNLNNEAELQNAVLVSLLGFSRVFRLLVELKKPIIAHNCTLDFMIMYKQFYRPLPKSYQAFKNSTNALFPLIYDTKYMSSEFRKKVSKGDCWSSNTLPGLFTFFTMGRGYTLVPCTPSIESKDYPPNVGIPKFHDAGWDSYCAGVCFIRLAHFFGALENGKLSSAHPFTSTELLAFSSHLANRINIIRGNLTHFVLDGPDPPSHRPEIVVVKRRDGGKLDAIDLTERFSKYGSVDIKLQSEKLAFVAASTKGMLMDICKEYYKHPEFVIVKYNRFNHDSFLHAISWCGLAALGTLTLLFFYRATRHVR